MPWSVKYSDSLNCVECVFKDLTTVKEIKHATSLSIAIAKERQTVNHLLDLRLMDYHGSIFALMDIPETQYTEEGLARHSKIALILPNLQKTKDDALFYETASVNRGWQVKSFETRENAIVWLNSPNKVYSI